jgi:hypothetical protein
VPFLDSKSKEFSFMEKQKGGKEKETKKEKEKESATLFLCNPSTLRYTRTTCLPQEMLVRLRNNWNDRYPAFQIDTGIRKKQELWKELRERLQHQYQCSTEYCALQELGTHDEKTTGARYFRPPKPTSWATNPTEWHNTHTILRVMEQYEDAYPQFEFIGPVPIDFDDVLPGGWGTCVVDELCKLDLHVLRKRGEKSVGIVFNLDPSDEPGSHWVCAYIDLMRKTAYYYDSYGYPPCAEIRRFLKRCKEQGCANILWNDICHQRKGTECGTYCMYILISLLEGRSFAEICNQRITDDMMIAFRDRIFVSNQK